MSLDTIQNNKLKLLGKLTAGLLHEIRNPLSAIKLNLDLVKYFDGELPEEVNESMRDCVKATERIEDLIENLLQFTRKTDLGKEWLSLNDVTLDAFYLLNIKASKKNILLQSDLSKTIPKLFLNENKLLQVFLNFITNAIDACSNRGRVTVKTYRTVVENKDSITWEVEDTGIGISEEDQRKIFDDFYTSKPEGTGLGLTVCRSLLNEMNAKIDFKSELGVGTLFKIIFEIQNN